MAPAAPAVGLDRAVIRRVLFVGLGGIGQRHLRNTRALLGENVVIDAYRVRGEQAVLTDQLAVVAGANLEQQYHLHVFHDLDRALSEKPDVVFVSNPSSLHVPIARRAAQAGAHLFIEKPLSNSLEGVDDLIQEVERRGLVGMVAYQLRRHPGFLLLQQRLAAGAIGRVLSVRAEVGEYLPGFHPYEDYRRMYAAKKELGGGVTLSQIHEIDFLIALFGMPRRAFALGGQVSSLELDVDDLSASLLEFKSDGRKLAVELHQDFFQRPASRRCTVLGESGKLEWSLSERVFRRWDAAGALAEQLDYSELPRNQMFLDELRYFFDCVAHRRPPDIDIREGARSLRVALGLLDSQSTGNPVHFTEEEAR